MVHTWFQFLSLYDHYHTLQYCFAFAFAWLFLRVISLCRTFLHLISTEVKTYTVCIPPPHLESFFRGKKKKKKKERDAIIMEKMIRTHAIFFTFDNSYWLFFFFISHPYICSISLPFFSIFRDITSLELFFTRLPQL